MSNPEIEFKRFVESNIARAGQDPDLARMSLDWMLYSGGNYGYSYNFTWLGRPVIQYPQDTVAMQELVWRTRPDVIIETGIAHGGSLILSASLLALLDYCDAASSGTALQPGASKRRVIGVDIEIRPHNKAAIERHPLSPLIHMIEASSIEQATIEKVRSLVKEGKRVMACLDSNHTHDHVLAELEAYAPLVTKGCYCVVFDTVIEDMPDGWFKDRPWNKGNNPRSALKEYLLKHPEFAIDSAMHDKLQITVAKEGFLERIA
jgi:cephalosporin hydroxylase